MLCGVILWPFLAWFWKDLQVRNKPFQHVNYRSSAIIMVCHYVFYSLFVCCSIIILLSSRKYNNLCHLSFSHSPVFGVNVKLPFRRWDIVSTPSHRRLHRMSWSRCSYCMRFRTWNGIAIYRAMSVEIFLNGCSNTCRPDRRYMSIKFVYALVKRYLFIVYIYFCRCGWHFVCVRSYSHHRYINVIKGSLEVLTSDYTESCR